MEDKEFRQRLIVAAIHGLTSNPVQAAEISKQYSLPDDLEPIGMIAVVAIEIANRVEMLERSKEEAD